MADIYDYAGPQVQDSAQPVAHDIYSYEPSQQGSTVAAEPYQGDLANAVANARAAAIGEVKGAWDTLVEGPGQFLTRSLAAAFPQSEWMRHQVDVSDAGQQARQSAYEDAVRGHETAGFIGNMAGGAIASYAIPAGNAEEGANLVNRLIYAAKFGAASGAAQPVQDPQESFWGKKVAQTAAGTIGGLFGGVIGEVGGWAASKAIGAWGATKDILGVGAEELEKRLPGVAQRMGSASPEIQQVVGAAKQFRDKINPLALNNQLVGDSLPVKVQFTEGQALENPVLVSMERNNRGLPNDPMPGFLNDQSRNLQANLEYMKRQVAPDVAVADNYDAGQNLIAAVQRKVSAQNQATSSAYRELSDANGGQIPLDGATFAAQAREALDSQMKGEFLPSQYQSILDQFANGKRQMTFENFENLRTMLAKTQRSTADGNVSGAAGIVRDALENMHLPANAAALKPLADAARASARQGFVLERSIPAYKAVADGSAVPDTFVRNFVSGGNTQQLQGLVGVLGDDPIALQTIKAAFVNDLQGAAGTSGSNFRYATYDSRMKALDKVSRKLDTVFSQDEAQVFRNVGEAARIANVQPAGSFVNNSGSAVALPGIVGSMAENSVNAAAKGLPVGTIARSFITSRASQNAAAQKAARSIAPGAGIVQSNPSVLVNELRGLAARGGGAAFGELSGGGNNGGE